MISLISPSRVSYSSSFYTTGGAAATGVPFQRKAFGAYGRIWVFYSNGTSICFRTSSDGGMNWSAETPVTPTSSNLGGNKFSLWWDGIYVHYVFNNATTTLQYRRGLPNAAGSITWDPARPITSTNAFLPAICLDSNGYPVVVYNDFRTGYGQLWLYRSSSKDGNWTTAPGFPKEITSAAEVAAHPETDVTHTYPSQYWQACPVPMLSGKIYVGYYFELSRVYGKVFDGTNFGNEEMPIDSITTEDAVWSIASYEDTVYLAAHTMSGMLLSTRRDKWYTTVLSDIDVETSVNQGTPAISIDDDGTPFVFWMNNDTVYCCTEPRFIPRKLIAGVPMSTGWSLSSFFKEGENTLGIILGAPVDVPRYVWFSGLLLKDYRYNRIASTWKDIANKIRVEVEVTNGSDTGIIMLKFDHIPTANEVRIALAPQLKFLNAQSDTTAEAVTRDDIKGVLQNTSLTADQKISQLRAIIRDLR